MEIPKRNLFFCADIDEENIKELVENIIKVNTYDDEQSQENETYERKPIKIYFSTTGGNMYVGFALYNYIKYSKTPVWLYISGYCFSAGFLIALASEKTFAYKNTTFMYHQLSYSRSNDSLQGHGEDFEQSKIYQEDMHKLIVQETKIPLDKLKYINERKIDWYIDVNEAKELGIIDEIIE